MFGDGKRESAIALLGPANGDEIIKRQAILLIFRRALTWPLVPKFFGRRCPNDWGFCGWANELRLVQPG
jgi:hypothetical protein